jgi:hypothetical protein
MSFLADNCVFSFFDKDIIKSGNSFTCGNDDLDNFFLEDAFLQSDQLLCKNYCFINEGTESDIVCVFTLSNDSIKNVPNARKKKVEKDIPHTKHYNSYPAVMIGRLGVNIKYQDKHIGSEVIDFIKAWFVDHRNKTGCRFLLVDSYNNANNFRFYQDNNGFQFLFGSEEQEKEYRDIKPENEIHTRLMYFDLIELTRI